MAMKGANLGFVSVFFEIPARVPSIYRGLSPSFPIRLGFDILTGFIEISDNDVSVSVATRCGVGDDRCWATPGSCMSEAGAGSARPVGRNSAHGQ
jgi:hypothetical protein